MISTLVFCLCMLAVELQPQENISPNPSFEEDLNRDDLPDGWTADSYQSKGILKWDKTVAHHGKASLRISDPGRDNSKDWQKSTSRWYSYPRPVEAGATYTLEVWMKTKNVTGRPQAILSWQGENRWLDQSSTKQISGTNDWQKLTLTARAPAKADSMILILGLGYGEGTVWFDELKVTGKSEPLPEVKYVFHDTKKWFPFEFPLDDINRDSIDLSHFLHTPAGKYGFVSVKPDGHLYYENGKRARFFGTNLGGSDCTPEKQTARMLADRFAKYGVNMVRLHSLDSPYGGLIDYSKGNSRNFDEDVLDRLDYLIAQFKKQGIYIYMDLLDYRMFKDADGVKYGDTFTSNWAGSMKGASIFDERMIELQKDYATKLLTHRNPYTGLRYVDDPAIALVETTNENSLFYFLSNAKLSLPYYREQLYQRWNRWLLSKYQTQSRLQKAWTGADGKSELFPEENLQKLAIQFPEAQMSRFSRGAMPDPLQYRMGPLRMRDTLHFLEEIQRSYHEQMQSHLKKNVGVRVPISGTNQVFTVCDTYVNADANDFVCGNQYWNHPSVKAKPFFKYANISRVRSDIPAIRGPMPTLARNTAIGKPMIVTEFNYPWPNDYRAEGLLMTTAYTCLQDWDALLLFSYKTDEKKLGWFRCQSDPTRWGTYPAAAAMFHRNDVKAARNEVHLIHTPESIFRLQPDERSAPYSTFRYLTFLSKVRNAFPKGEYSGNASVVLATGPSTNAKVAEGVKTIRFSNPPWKEWQYAEFVKQAQKLNLPGYDKIHRKPKRYDSDTGELSLDNSEGLFTINTSHTKSAIGFLNQQKEISLGEEMTISHCKTPFAAITVTSMDGKPIGQSKRILLTTVAKAEHTAQGFWPAPINPQSWSPYTTWRLPGVGRLPVIAEPVDATISLNIPSSSVKVYELDETGKRRKKQISFQKEKNGSRQTIQFNPVKGRSIWYEIVCE